MARGEKDSGMLEICFVEIAELGNEGKSWCNAREVGAVVNPFGDNSMALPAPFEESKPVRPDVFLLLGERGKSTEKFAMEEVEKGCQFLSHANWDCEYHFVSILQMRWRGFCSENRCHLG